MRALLLGFGLFAAAAGLHAAPQMLPTNLSAPFCYDHGGVRRWPVLNSPLAENRLGTLRALREERELARGERLEFSGLVVSLGRDGWLEIQSRADAAPLAFDLEINLEGNGGSETQRLAVRNAPPPRPISYIADFGDDLIDLFMDRKTGRWRPLEKGAFDQYFRKLQAHGVGRLIVWQSPFPYMADAKNYRDEDWQRYTTQARAIIESPELGAILEKRGGIISWGWLRQLMAVRLTPQFGDLLTRSAVEHGIKLTASFRPFEMALDKYYAVPAFDESGEFLWNFHPMASPAVDYHADEVGFAHYRKVLEAAEHADAGRLQALEIKGVIDAKSVRLIATPFPPLQHDSFVLVRGKDGKFQLRPFREIQPQADARCQELKNITVELDGQGTTRISGIVMPENCRYLVLSNLDAPSKLPVTLVAKAGNELGRANVYWAAAPDDGEGKRTRVGGITADGDFCSVFYAVEASLGRAPQRNLKREQLVVDLGDPWSVEMVDFNQPAARRYAVDELRSILTHAPFDEIFINTRSHTSLAATLADGKDGVKPLLHYSAAKQPYVHLGLDRAYAPRGAANDPRLRSLTSDRTGIERITTWQPGEWDNPCQSPDSPFVWRYARNRGVADGVRQLLEDLEKAFPKTRIRAVIPEGGQAVANVQAALDTMAKPGGGVYGRDYYRHIWASINHIPAIGEGMTMLNLKGLRVEPVFGGIRFLPDRGPFDFFVRETIADLSGNRGSSFRGPRSFFYEGHETLRTTDAKAGRDGREERIRHLLDQRGEINEVILYEAAAWLGLPLNDPDLCGHGFLDRPGKAAPTK
ncbi:MAG: hypothetical protein U0984_13300 [Prosthecobacter sp.]|nr:hypothetical protein [Prosthecobacter sp.]